MGLEKRKEIRKNGASPLKRKGKEAEQINISHQSLRFEKGRTLSNKARSGLQAQYNSYKLKLKTTLGNLKIKSTPSYLVKGQGSYYLD